MAKAMLDAFMSVGIALLYYAGKALIEKMIAWKEGVKKNDRA